MSRRPDESRDPVPFAGRRWIPLDQLRCREPPELTIKNGLRHSWIALLIGYAMSQKSNPTLDLMKGPPAPMRTVCRPLAATGMRAVGGAIEIFAR